MLKTKIINYNTNDVYTAELLPRSSRQSECLIGRHPDCDLVLDGPAVSRVHGRVLFESGQCFFADLGSTDGSRLNNEETRVNQTYEIAPDDVIRIGEFALIVEALAAKTSASSATGNAQASEIWAGEEVTARCVQIVTETHNVKTFRFVAEPNKLFNFKPGQFVTLQLPIEKRPTDEKLPTGETRPTLRSYSISSSPSQPHTLDITVKRVGPARDKLPPGLASNWLHDHLTVGMTLQVQGPFGSFNCIDHPADKLLLISAGSGITPMMSMAQWLSDFHPERLRQRTTSPDITFIHAARSPQDIIFRQRLELLAAQHPHFKLAFTLTQQAPAHPWAGYRGRLNPALLAAICPDFAERSAFVCGPAGFMESTKALLEAEGFLMENYFEESFGGPAVAKTDTVKSTPAKTTTAETTSSLQAPLVEFSTSGKAIACDEADTLLDAAEQAGVSMTSGCRMGSCGVCKHSVAAGEVCYDVEPRGLSESDRAAGQILVCIAKPVGKVVLAL
ncbi:MAG: FHA domain-containing protein [Phormidesmis sp.]